MAATTTGSVTSGLRKFEPTAKLPSAAVLDKLSAADRRLLRRRLREPVESVLNPCFLDDDAEDRFLGPLPGTDHAARDDAARNDDSGVDWIASGSGASLTSEQEQHLFLRLNYYRWRAMQIMEAHAGRRLSEAATHAYLLWDRRTERTRSDIVRVNMPLVLAMAKRTRINGVDFADLISEGNLALMRSVDKFDCSRGFKFSTYACRAILKSFSRVATRTSRYRGHFPTEFDPTLEKSDFLEKKRVNVEDDCVDELRSILGENSAQLSDVEATVIRARFALDGSEPAEGDGRRGKTLEQVGEMIGVTKERVRQIQNKALGKLRVALEDGVLAV